MIFKNEKLEKKLTDFFYTKFPSRDYDTQIIGGTATFQECNLNVQDIDKLSDNSDKENIYCLCCSKSKKVIRCDNRSCRY